MSVSVKRLLVFLIIMGVFLVLFFGVGRHPYSFLALNIYHVAEDQQLLVKSVKVKPGDEVILSYIHSSDKTPVKQVFTVSGDELLKLQEERYRWYGAGLEFGSRYEVNTEDGWVRITGYDRSFETLPVRVAETVSQELVVNDKVIVLTELAPPLARLTITVEQMQTGNSVAPLHRRERGNMPN